jgi:alkanesulfonate monooxygenase SsuD/methylene tetrahydromethanopterin reductase-like flavin-dependent oxidoreductase (luciferase family)
MWHPSPMLRLGLFLPTIESLHGARWLPQWTELREIARLAEDVGFDTLFVPDHLLMRASPYWGFTDADPRGTWEAWTMLGAIAEATRRIELGTYVSASSFRQPALLAKMAVTVDEISGGRLVLGLGTGSHQPEYTAFGFAWDHLVGRFEEALRILVPLLREGRVDFAGHYYTARDCELLPRGPRSGGPPIWIAAFGPRMLRVVARWADAFNTSWHTDPNALEGPFAALDMACQQLGRDPSTLGRTIGTFVALDEHESTTGRVAREGLRGTPEQIAGRLIGLAAAGATHITCMLSPADTRGIERFAPVIQALRNESVPLSRPSSVG